MIGGVRILTQQTVIWDLWYAVIEKVRIAWELYVGINLTSTSDCTRNIFWLASCFSKIKKPNLENQTVIAGVCIFDTTSYIYP